MISADILVNPSALSAGLFSTRKKRHKCWARERKKTHGRCTVQARVTLSPQYTHGIQETNRCAKSNQGQRVSHATPALPVGRDSIRGDSGCFFFFLNNNNYHYDIFPYSIYIFLLKLNFGMSKETRIVNTDHVDGQSFDTYPNNMVGTGGTLFFLCGWDTGGGSTLWLLIIQIESH